MEATAYVLASISNGDQLLPSIEFLARCPDVLEWRAVEGLGNIMIRARMGSSSLPATVQSLDAISELRVMQIVESDRKNPPVASIAEAFALLEVEEEHRGEVFNAVKQLQGVLDCSRTTGEYGVIALIGDASFDGIEQFIAGTIRPLAHVQRVRHCDVINLQGF
ncbi:MAG: Lrp/AsnC ligand binding domain-containing protein [Ignavibacteriales bacterium]|nr:Lrp/AsnC ligand binding domain-containing protein [Ignavibacteriales bacterium]